MEQIFGFIERITFQNNENGFTIAHIKIAKRQELVCVVGNLMGVKPGETIRCKGSFQQHLIHGMQFIVKECHIEAPADLVGIKRYLGSGLIKGIGPVYANRIVQQFGIETLHIIDCEPDKLYKIEGLGKKRVDLILQCWSEQKVIRDLMLFLQTHEISPSYAQKIYKKHGKESIAKIKENPFNLARDIFGIGFKGADKVAEKLGIPKNSPLRIASAIEHFLFEHSNNGHVCYPLKELKAEAKIALEVSEDLLQEAIATLQKEARIELFSLTYEGSREVFIWSSPLFYAEVGIAKELLRLKQGASNLRSIQIDKALLWVQDKLKIELAHHQTEAVSCALTEKVHIITGGPGTGKSTITNAILTISQKLTDKIVLAAPTGRAAKRMSEITKKKASTIHSLLEFDFKNGGFKKNGTDPIDCDLIIVDEASMIDTYLMFHLLKAIPTHARLIIVGDINQLPSVGAGNVLKDILASKVISMTMLTEIFRQALGSHIVTNAHLINKGIFPEINNESKSDFFFIEENDPEEVLKQINALVTVRLPNKYDLNPITDIQVLAPMRKGVIGVNNLNSVLQQSFNPNGEAIYSNGVQFKLKDKVMQTRNDYNREVFNGDIGTIIEINKEDQQLMVDFDGHHVLYEASNFDELSLSYAVSIHKFQGSECPCIVIPIHTSHFKLLTRNLLYTGVTRGKRLVVLVGTKKALAIAVHNDEVKKRFTGLKHALLGMDTEGYAL